MSDILEMQVLEFRAYRAMNGKVYVSCDQKPEIEAVRAKTLRKALMRMVDKIENTERQ